MGTRPARTGYPAAVLPAGTQQLDVELASGTRLHVLEIPAKGPAVVFVHGFPELSIVWCEQLRAVAAAGFRAIAPDMRGYGFSDAPRQVDAYGMQQLTDDMCQLLDAMGIERAFFVGHDMGGFVIWSQVFHNEHRCLGAASFNTPLTLWGSLRAKWEAAGLRGPMAYLATLPSEAAGTLDYQVYFNLPDLPERELEADVGRTLNAFFRAVRPNAEHDVNMRYLSTGMRTSRVRKNNNRGILALAAEKLERDKLWSEAELSAYVEAFERQGFFGPLAYYRNFDANQEWLRQVGCAPEVPGCKIVQVPCLMVTADQDLVLPPSSAAGMERYFTRLSWAELHCGHWVQHEAPKAASKVLLAWLNSAISRAAL